MGCSMKAMVTPTAADALPRVQGGFTLVEVLVTVIVVAIGLLGLAGVQLAGMRSNHSAYLRTQATIAAYDLIDRMRMDPNAFNGLSFTAGSDTGNVLFDAWEEELDRIRLPAPASGNRAQVDCTTGNFCNPGHCDIAIRWNDARAEDSGLAQTGRATGAMVFRVCTRLAE